MRSHGIERKLTTWRQKYFDRIIEDNIFPDYDFRVHNKIAEIRRNGDKKMADMWLFHPIIITAAEEKKAHMLMYVIFAWMKLL